MKKKLICLLLALVLIASLSACASSAGTTTATTAAASGDTTAAAKTDFSDETYVWACQYNTLPLFVANDYIGMDLIAQQLGVTVKKIGPQEVDLPAFIAAMEQEIANKPDGMMVVGWDASEATVIDKIMDAGIPVVTVDADVANCKRLCFVGTNWYDLGVAQAQAAAPYLEGKSGRAVYFGIPGADNTVSAYNGYCDTMAKLCPNVTVDATCYDTKSTATVVAETAGNLLKADSSIVTIAGFDSSCGPGIAQAIKEANLVGKVYGTCVDAESEHLQGVKDGALAGAIGQKRIFFTYYGVRMLFDYNHNGIDFTGHDKELGISPIPTTIYTGFITVTPDNVDYFLSAKK